MLLNEFESNNVFLILFNFKEVERCTPSEVYDYIEKITKY